MSGQLLWLLIKLFNDEVSKHYDYHSTIDQGDQSVPVEKSTVTVDIRYVNQVCSVKLTADQKLKQLINWLAY